MQGESGGKISAADLEVLLSEISDEHTAPPPRVHHFEEDSTSLRFRLFDAIFAHDDKYLDSLVASYLRLFRGLFGYQSDDHMCLWLFGESGVMRPHACSERAMQDLRRIVAHPVLWDETAETRCLILSYHTGFTIAQQLLLCDMRVQSHPSSTAWVDFLLSEAARLRLAIDSLLDKGGEDLKRMWRFASLDASRKILDLMLGATAQWTGERLGAFTTALYELQQSDDRYAEIVRGWRHRLEPTLARRRSWLTSQVQVYRQESGQDWALPPTQMPHWLPTEELRAFLLGPSDKIKMPCPSGIREARRLADSIGRVTGKWTIQAVAKGSGKKAVIEVTKIGDWREMKNQELAVLEQGMKEVMVLLDCKIDAVPALSRIRRHTPSTAMAATDARRRMQDRLVWRLVDVYTAQSVQLLEYASCRYRPRSGVP